MNPTDMSPATTRIINEREHRLRDARSMLKFGVHFLDKAMGGIRKKDLLLLGAKSGAGKTELVATIAKANLDDGKRVHVFCLEAEEREFERRILYKLIAQEYFKDKDRPQFLMSYRDWLLGELDDYLEKYELEAHRVFEARYQGLHTIYRKGEFTVVDFERTLLEIKDQTDLVIIDHLNYFDFSENQLENVAISRIVKRIRDLALLTGIPHVVVAHIRKKDRFSKAIMPDMEDFHGSSDIYKIATQIVLVAPAPRGTILSATSCPTYFRAAKLRIDGSATRYLARCAFNIERNEYDKGFQLGHWQDGLDEFQPIQEAMELPRWAREKQEVVRDAR